LGAIWAGTAAATAAATDMDDDADSDTPCRTMDPKGG
jgi:hypothetical protein